MNARDIADSLDEQDARYTAEQDAFYASASRNPEFEFETGCRNCGGETDPAHDDMCCTCMEIVFGQFDHATEHLTAGRGARS